MMKKKKAVKIIGSILGLILLMVAINFIPTIRLKTAGMKVIRGNNVDAYYEKEEAAAKDVFALADSKAEEISKKLGFFKKQPVKIYIYDEQSTMQTKKYGLIIPLLGLDWYIGDNRGTDVILTSPANPGKVHDYDNNKEAVLHEMVHAYISILNPHLGPWLNNGVALYLTNGQPFYKEYLNSMQIPSYSDTNTENPIKFSDIGGYTFANTYIEYLDKQYGWNRVLELVKDPDYPTVFGKSEREIYDAWVGYIENYEQ